MSTLINNHRQMSVASRNFFFGRHFANPLFYNSKLFTDAKEINF